MVQVTHATLKILQLALVRALQLARLANGQVQAQLDAALSIGCQPARTPARRAGRKADFVLARVGRREGEASTGATTLRDDTVVVVKCFLQRRCQYLPRIRACLVLPTSTEMEMLMPSCFCQLLVFSSNSSAL